MKCIKWIKRITGLIFCFFGILILLLAIPYIIAPVYKFSPEKPFSGKFYYNPYIMLTDSSWKLANFHAHSYSWAGITNGSDTHADTLVDVYKKMGYSHIGISNYHKITPVNEDGFASIPAYEHGYNIQKRHHLCLGTEKVCWFDFIFWQTLSNKQFMLNWLRNTTDFLSINHPKFCDGFVESDFAALSNYDAVEVLNHYRTSIPHWDSALSSGYYAVLLANDDVHDVKGMRETGVCITVVNTELTNRHDIVEALKAGRHYGVKVNPKPDENLQIKRERNANLIRPKSISMNGDTLNAVFNRQFAEIRFVGQNGKIKRTSAEKNFDSYVFDADDTYIRIELNDSEGNLYLLNPVIRSSDGYPATPERYKTNIWQTTIKRAAILIVILLILSCFYRRRKRRIKNFASGN